MTGKRVNNKKEYCKIFILRHGQTDWNVKRLIQGQKNPPLNPAGKRNVKELEKELQHISFDVVYSSDLLRAKQTAEIIAKERNLLVTTTKLLRERAFGKYEGKHVDAVKELDALLATMEQQIRFSYKHEPDIESDEEIISRFITSLREIAIINAGKTVLVITHSGMMRVFLAHIGFDTYENLQEKYITNGGYIELLSDGVDFFIKNTKGIIDKTQHYGKEF